MMSDGPLRHLWQAGLRDFLLKRVRLTRLISHGLSVVLDFGQTTRTLLGRVEKTCVQLAEAYALRFCACSRAYAVKAVLRIKSFRSRYSLQIWSLCLRSTKATPFL